MCRPPDSFGATKNETLFSAAWRGRLAQLAKTRRRTPSDQTRQKRNATGGKISRGFESAAQPDRYQSPAARGANCGDCRRLSEDEIAKGRAAGPRFWHGQISRSAKTASSQKLDAGRP